MRVQEVERWCTRIECESAARREITLAGQEGTKRLSLVYHAESRHMTKERYVGPLENNGVCPSRTSLEACMENAFLLSTSLGK